MSDNDRHRSREQVSASPHQVDTIDTQNWCETRQKKAHFSYVWKIHDFKYYLKDVCDRLESSTFSPNENCKIKLCLFLDINKDYSDFVSVYLRLMSSEKAAAKINFKLMILNNKQIMTNKRGGSDKFVLAGSWGHPKFISRAELHDPLKGLLPEGNLTLFCEGSVLMDSVRINGQGNKFKFPAYQLVDNFNALFECEKFSDVTLVAGGSDIRAHKAILSAQSPVFAAMFDHEMKEHEQNCVNITDINYEALKELLLFMYTGRALKLDNMAGELLAAADKYALERLKVMCEESLFNNISIETAAETLISADMHSAKQLKTRTIDFIVKRFHTMDVMETSGWKNVVSTFPHLVAEVLLELAANQKNLPTGPQ